MTPDEAYQWLVEHSVETAYMQSMGQVLGWDQRTYIPAKGHEHRHNQFALLAKWIHARVTDPRVGEALHQVEGTDLVADPRRGGSGECQGVAAGLRPGHQNPPGVGRGPGQSHRRGGNGLGAHPAGERLGDL